MEKIGDKLYNLRLEHKISQEQLGEKIGVTRQTISLWEANRRQINAEKLRLICEVFDISPEYFLVADNDNKMTSVTLSNDEDIVCAELNQEDQNGITESELNLHEEKKKLSKKNAVLIAVMVVAIIIGVIAAVVIKMYSYNDVEAHQSVSSSAYNFDDLYWLIPGFASLVVIIVVAKLIKINIKQKK